MSLHPLLSQFEAPPVESVIEWRGKRIPFLLRELSSAETEALFDINDAEGNVDPTRARGLRSRILAACVVDADGKPVLTEAEAGQLPSKIARALERDAADLNGFAAPDDDDAGNG